MLSVTKIISNVTTLATRRRTSHLKPLNFSFSKPGVKRYHDQVDQEQCQTLLQNDISIKQTNWTNRFLTLIFVAIVVVYVHFLFNSFQQSSKILEPDTQQSIDELINQSVNEFIDPLPSCSIINQHLTRNLLHHQWMIQNHHVHSDCSDYAITGQCTYHSQSINQSNNRSVSFTPKWLVFHINSGVGKEGTGGLADRLKGMLTSYALSLLLGRGFALHVEDFVPFTALYDRGVVEWMRYEDIHESVRNSKKVRSLNWQGWWNQRPMFDKTIHQPINRSITHDWRSEWKEFDIVSIQSNINGFTDLMDHPNLIDAYRAFGFHAATEKGDLDLYFECLMDSLFTYTKPVIDVINPLLQSINRPGLVTWDQRINSIPSLDQIIARQLVEERVNKFSKHSLDRLNELSSQQSLRLYRSKSNKQTINKSNNQSHSLYCLQIRMGSNGRQTTNNRTVGFVDSEDFLKVDQLEKIFREMEASMMSIKQSINQSNNQTITLFITADTDVYLNYIPRSLLSLPMLVVPGQTAHIDKMQALFGQPRAMLSANIKTIATHHMLGECDAAWVTASGFGPTGLWRGRNRHHELHPIEDQVWENKFKIEKSGQIRSYVHFRGSGGRGYWDEYRSIPTDTRALIEKQMLINQTLIEAFRTEKHDKYQASAHLEYPVPNDPFTVSMKIFKL